MSLSDTLKNAQCSVLNRYDLSLPGCKLSFDVEDFEGHEGLSEPYHYSIRFTSPEHDIQAAQMLCKNGALIMRALPDSSLGEPQSPVTVKMVHGVITSFQRITGSRDQVTYKIALQPSLALLAHQYRSHRFFINKSVPDVVEQILTEHGLKGWEFDFRLKRSYPKREQINQYQENDLKFIQRLLAEVGIFYLFSLQSDTLTEVVHFGDSQAALTFDKTLALNSPSGMSDGGAESVWGLSVAHDVVATNVTTKDYNHRQAKHLLLSDTADVTCGDGEDIHYGEVYHYWLRHLERGDSIDPATETANFYARLDHERMLVAQTTITGKSCDATLLPAQVLTITGSLPLTLPLRLQKPVLLTCLTFTGSRAHALQIRFKAVPYSDTICWRPPLIRRPKVAGTMTAFISSAKEDDTCAWLDSAGLYRVKFDADLFDKTRGQESMPVRLAKPYGGDSFGFHFPLLQGTEVAIAFHEGDPDRPYIAHVLHNSHHPDHVTELNPTRNVLRTQRNNKLRMEDKAGEEHIKLSTEYGGKTQLNLGHNVNVARKLRGEGAELRTDRWVSVRGGSGVFISADKQTSAGGMMLNMPEALKQLEQAHALTESLRDAASTAKAELADLQIQKNLLNETLNELKQAALLLSAPAGIASTTPKSVQISAGENLILTGGKSADLSVLNKFTVAAGEAISLFAQKMGIKLFAAKGKMEIQAQGGEMTLDALQDLRISSSQGQVIIQAKQDIWLVGSGGAYVRIGGGEVESGAPDKIIQRAAVWQKFSGQSASQALNMYQQGDYELKTQMVWAATEDAAENRQAIINSDFGKATASSGDDGQVTTQHYTDMTSVNIKLNKDIQDGR